MVSNILVNDADPQGDAFNVVTFVYDSDGDGIPDATGTVGGSAAVVAGVDESGNPVANAGTLTIGANGNLVFTPADGFAGQVFVDYTIEDNVATPNTASDDAQIVITVLRNENGPLNDPPIAGDDFSYTEVNTPVDGNFIGNDSDLSGDPLSIRDSNGAAVTIDPNGPRNPVNTVTTVEGGELTFYSDGTYTYTPPAGYVGPDRVVYEICDVTVVEPQPLCAQATIHLLIGSKPGFDISGMVWHDFDNGNAVQDGTETPVSGSNDNNGGNSTVTGGAVYANLVDNVTGTIVATTQVLPDGTYLFEGVTEGDYSIILTNVPQTVSGTLANGSLPAGWVATGVNVNGSPNTSNHSNVISLGLVTATVENVNFGIQQPPVTAGDSYEIATPVSGFVLPLDGSALTTDNEPVNGTRQTDPEEGQPVLVTITELPTTPNGLGEPKLFYDGVEITVAGTILGTAADPYDPAKLSIRFDGIGYTAVSFNFTSTDGAGAVSNESTYTVQWENSLPVTLVRFDVVREGTYANLSWTTSSEVNSKGFEIERSVDADLWTKAGYVASQNNNSSHVLRYHFTDASPARGVNYYRLKMVDLDGTFAYSDIRSIVLAGDGLTLYPNPVTHGKLTLDLADASGSRVKVYSTTGQEVLRASGSRTLDVSQLPSGVYVIRVTTRDGVTTSRTFVVK